MANDSQVVYLHVFNDKTCSILTKGRQLFDCRVCRQPFWGHALSFQNDLTHPIFFFLPTSLLAGGSAGPLCEQTLASLTATLPVDFFPL